MYDIKDMTYVSTVKKTVYKYVGLGTVVIIITILCILPPFLSYSETTVIKRQTFPTDLKYILFWTGPDKKTERKSFKSRYGSRESEHSPGQLMFINQKCPYINCYITYNKTFIESEYFDAVVFEAREIFHVQDNIFNITRSPDQKYIFKSLEPSEYTPICHKLYDNFFNWTWTYKLNSDLPHTFVNIYNDKDVLIGPDINLNWISKMNRTGQFINIVKRKTKAVAWFIGKCKIKSKHRDFIDDLTKELKSYNYTIDTFGPCGRKLCQRSQSEECHKMIENDYYFQLVLEESTSEDFITERLAKVLSYLTIPIVSGEVDYSR